jgi:hypothetical protein
MFPFMEEMEMKFFLRPVMAWGQRTSLVSSKPR